MTSKPALLKTLKLAFAGIGLFYVFLMVMQIVNGFIHKSMLIDRLDLLDYLGRFFVKAAMGTLCLVVSRVYGLLLTRDVGSLAVTRRILHVSCLSFSLLGLISVAGGIGTFSALQAGQQGGPLFVSIGLANIVLVKALPIVCGISIPILFDSLVGLVDFESWVA